MHRFRSQLNQTLYIVPLLGIFCFLFLLQSLLCILLLRKYLMKEFNRLFTEFRSIEMQIHIINGDIRVKFFFERFDKGLVSFRTIKGAAFFVKGAPAFKGNEYGAGSFGAVQAVGDGLGR